MSGFLNHIIARHTNSVQEVQPRLFNRFETKATEEQKPVTAIDIKTKTSVTKPTATTQHPATEKAFHTTTVPAIAEKLLYREASETNHLYSPTAHTNGDILLTGTSKTLPEREEKEIGTEKLNPSHNQHQVFVKNEMVSSRQIDHITNIQNQPTEIFKNQDQLMVNADLNNIGGSLNDDLLPGSSHQTGTSVIKVTIGRVDVRANTSSLPSRTQSATSTNTKMSLDDYFKKKNRS